MDPTCQTCGRTMSPRASWTRRDQVPKYCSDGCRRHKPGPADRALEAQLLTLLAARPRGATICPSEAARALHPDDWRDRMEATRQAARRLVAAGKVEITQGGRVVDPSTARGPIRVRSVDPLG